MLACVIAGFLLFVSTHLGNRIKNLPFFTKVYATEQLILKNIETILELSKDEENRMLLKSFLEAMVDATIEFDYIPRNELEYFIPITLSLNENIQVKGFEYNNENLVIQGVATNEIELTFLVEALYENAEYELIESHAYKNEKNQIVFSLECIK